MADRTPLPTPHLEESLRQKARELGVAWASSNVRPRIAPESLRHWDFLIDQWIADADMPLAVRKQTSASARGGFIRHRTGREIIVTDNAPAQWAFTCAFENRNYSLAEVKMLLEEHKIPFAFASKKLDRVQENYKYRGTVSSCKVDLNKVGWKLCHIDGVGLNSRLQIEELPIEDVKRHFRLLISPRNQFLIPKEWAGLGELEEVIEEIRTCEKARTSLIPEL